MTIPSGRRATLLCAGTGLVLTFLAILAAFPVSWGTSLVERMMSEELGSDVSIQALRREEAFSFKPTIAVQGIAVPQADWAGPGHLATIQTLRFRIPVLPLLIGRVRPELVSASGVHLDLVRTADGQENWRKDKAQREGGARLDFASLTVADGTIRYRDAKQRREASLKFSVSPRGGFAASGTGAVDGNPVRLSLAGPAARSGKAWPFKATIDGPALTMKLEGTMPQALAMERMSFTLDARANDLKLIDRVIEAGLFGTQPVALRARVDREPGKWHIRTLSGTIGSSPIDGRLDVVKADGRTRLDGRVHFSQLDFEDLASDAGNAAAAALERSQGLRIVPNLRVNIRKIDRTDGRIVFRVDQVVSKRRPSSLRSASGVLLLDKRLLRIEDLSIGLAKGRITGRATVDQRRGQPEPTVTLALDLKDSSIGALAGGGAGIDAPVAGRARLTGVGSTIREAVGRSNGRIGLVASNGVLPEKLARLMGFDIAAAFADGSDRTSLHCAAIRLDMRGGVGRVDPLLVDTSVSQSRGTGTIRFPNETIAVTLTGTPKDKAALRVPGSVSLRGTIREPEVVVPKEVKSVGNILRAVGRAISGKNESRAGNADCGALRRQVLG